MIFSRRAQTMIEYTLIVGVVSIVLYYMGASIKRSVQGLIKVTADQIGNQQNSDQDFTDYQQGYLISSKSQTLESKSKWVAETGYINRSGTPIYTGHTNFNEDTYSTTNTLTNGGFSPQGG